LYYIEIDREYIISNNFTEYIKKWVKGQISSSPTLSSSVSTVSSSQKKDLKPNAPVYVPQKTSSSSSQTSLSSQSLVQSNEPLTESLFGIDTEGGKFVDQLAKKQIEKLMSKLQGGKYTHHSQSHSHSHSHSTHKH
jgi:hypothetical protein